jgi:dTDP-4-amino-4,6-dideoxygalactose transaminase
MGIKSGYKAEDLPITEDLALRITRLPFYTELANNGLDYCIESMHKVLNDLYN